MRHEASSNHNSRRPRHHGIWTALTASTAAVSSFAMGGQASAATNQNHAKEAIAQTQNTRFYPSVLTGPVISKAIAGVMSEYTGTATDNIRVLKGIAPNGVKAAGKLSDFSKLPPLPSQIDKKPAVELMWSANSDSPNNADGISIVVFKDSGGKEFKYLQNEARHNLNHNWDTAKMAEPVNGHPAVQAAGRLITYYAGYDIDVSGASTNAANLKDNNIEVAEQQVTVTKIVQNFAFK